ncbi:MAG: ABC transporter ATP-binding protein/permease [Hyphomicrobiales bacterium]
MSKSAQPEPTVRADGGDWQTMKNLWPFIWPADRKDLQMRVAIAMVFLVIGKIITVLTPYTYKWATDALTGEGGLDGWPLWLVTPVMLIVAYGMTRILAMVFNQIRDAYFARVGQHAVRRLAQITFAHMHNLSLRFHLERRTGGLSRVIERGVKGIEGIVRFSILSGAPTLLEFIFMAVVFYVQFGLIYVVILAVTVYGYSWFTIKASNWRIAIRRDMNNSDTEANSKAIDSLLNFETVKYFGNEKMEAARFDESMARYETSAVKVWTSLAWLNIGQTVILTIGVVLCMILSGLAVQNGTQTIGDFVMINALLIQLAIPLNFIGFVYREIKQGLTDTEEMFALLDVPAEIKDAEDAKPLKAEHGAVRFENVQFSYDPKRPILKGVDFEVPAGKTIAIVGPSGAGKSTISRLLFRFYEASSGRVTIDGQDIRDVTQNSLRSAIGMVPQDTVLFNDTVAYNIRYGRPSASDEEVREAARMAQIADFIETLPEGFDTEVGERGLKLSGGEKQRVAIARTILKAPPILLLDEATSALDTHTEREIQAALDEVSQDRTTLVIAHRLSTVIGADEIIVLERGEIRERGKHDELLNLDGLYASMWARQREASEAEERLRAVHEEAAEFVQRGKRAEDEH